MRSLILGATAGVGRALAESLAARGDDLVLVATDARDLNAMAGHIRCLYGSPVETVVTDASFPEGCVADIERAVDSIGSPDRFFFPIGVSSADDHARLDAADTAKLLNTNFTVIVAVVARFLPQLMSKGSGSIVGFGSVAAVRGRSSNVVYAASKRALESYFESLRHITSSTDVEVSFYRLGYVDSQQSFGQRLIFPKATPRSVAAAVVGNLGRGGGFRNFPWYWAIIGRAVSLVPWTIFKRMKF